MEKKLEEVCRAFRIEGIFDGYEEIKTGNINRTYRVHFIQEDNPDHSFIVQKVNQYAFKKPLEVMENIDKVTEFIRAKDTGKVSLHFHHTPERRNWWIDSDGEFWRLFNYVDSQTIDHSTDKSIVYNTGLAFGRFQRLLQDFDASTLHETIVDFHNTAKRYEAFDAIVAADPVGRLESVAAEVAWLQLVREKACVYYTLDLPVRVTHNDTKINNVLFSRTGEPLVVIDLDTVMPGLVAYDFGDAVRFAANTAAEDANVSQVHVDMNVFRAFAEGFLSQVGDTLTEAEISTLYLSPFVLTAELAVRFLGDYIDGDKYFRPKYEGHNLVRARNQIALAKDMLLHEQEFKAVIEELI